MKKLIGLLLITICAACAEQESQQGLPKATGSTYQMMTSYLEPAADKIWGSAGLIITEDGEVDLRPTTEEGWLNVINAATVVAEGGNLLLINGPNWNLVVKREPSIYGSQSLEDIQQRKKDVTLLYKNLATN